ncbi:unnamed protein product, partial [Diamesa serratosioi]
MENSCDKIAMAAVNSDNKMANHCNSYLLNGVFNSIKNSSKLSIDDESSNQINRSNTNNNKCGRKRNINMMWENKDAGDGDGDGDGDDNDEKKSKWFGSYQPWVLKTYGDQAKTKTITLKKQTRILCALKGLESNRPDSSKFRFWVKSKGFMMELPLEFKNQLKSPENASDDDGCLLFVPCKSDVNNVIFKRVAVVEYFFHIIYKVHCSVGVGERRHVGQKRTYRKITENYSFLPREAVTKFLSQCHDCRKKPISQSLTIPSSHSSETQSTPSLYTTAKSLDSITTPLSISTSIANCKTSPIISTTTDSN